MITLILHMSDSSSLFRLIHEIEPDEIYNLAAQSYVQVFLNNPMRAER